MAKIISPANRHFLDGTRVLVSLLRATFALTVFAAQASLATTTHVEVGVHGFVGTANEAGDTYSYIDCEFVDSACNLTNSDAHGRVTGIADGGAGGRNIEFGGERLPVFLKLYAVAELFPGNLLKPYEYPYAQAKSRASLVADDVFVNNPFAPVGSTVDGNLFISFDGFLRVVSRSSGDTGSVNIWIRVNTDQSMSEGEAHSTETKDYISVSSSGYLSGILDSSPHHISEELTFPITFVNGGYNLLNISMVVEAFSVQQPSRDSAWSRDLLTVADFQHTLKFPTDGLAFSFSPEYTVSSESLHIADGRYIGPDIDSAVPEPSSLALLTFALVALGFRRTSGVSSKRS